MSIRLREIAVIVAICAFFFAGIARQSYTSETICMSATLFFMLLAIPLAIANIGPKRVFWIAFFCASSAYLEFSQISFVQIWPWPAGAPRLITHKLADYVDLRRAEPPDQPDTTDGQNPFDFGDDNIGDAPFQTPTDDAPAEVLDEFPLNLSIVVGSGESVHKRLAGSACFHCFLATALGAIAGWFAATIANWSSARVVT